MTIVINNCQYYCLALEFKYLHKFNCYLILKAPYCRAAPNPGSCGLWLNLGLLTAGWECVQQLGWAGLGCLVIRAVIQPAALSDDPLNICQFQPSHGWVMRKGVAQIPFCYQILRKTP